MLAEVTEIDHQRVLAVTPTKFRGRQSGAETEQRCASLVTVRDGKVVRTEVFSPLSRPSKQPGCGSRRCRRRTSPSSGRESKR
jgi:hypothetical protein